MRRDSVTDRAHRKPDHLLLSRHAVPVRTRLGFVVRPGLFPRDGDDPYARLPRKPFYTNRDLHGLVWMKIHQKKGQPVTLLRYGPERLNIGQVEILLRVSHDDAGLPAGCKGRRVHHIGLDHPVQGVFPVSLQQVKNRPAARIRSAAFSCLIVIGHTFQDADCIALLKEQPVVRQLHPAPEHDIVKAAGGQHLPHRTGPAEEGRRLVHVVLCIQFRVEDRLVSPVRLPLEEGPVRQGPSAQDRVVDLTAVLEIHPQRLPVFLAYEFNLLLDRQPRLARRQPRLQAKGVRPGAKVKPGRFEYARSRIHLPAAYELPVDRQPQLRAEGIATPFNRNSHPVVSPLVHSEAHGNRGPVLHHHESPYDGPARGRHVAVLNPEIEGIPPMFKKIRLIVQPGPGLKDRIDAPAGTDDPDFHRGIDGLHRLGIFPYPPRIVFLPWIEDFIAELPVPHMVGLPVTVRRTHGRPVGSAARIRSVGRSVAVFHPVGGILHRSRPFAGGRNVDHHDRLRPELLAILEKLIRAEDLRIAVVVVRGPAGNRADAGLPIKVVRPQPARVSQNRGVQFTDIGKIGVPLRFCFVITPLVRHPPVVSHGIPVKHHAVSKQLGAHPLLQPTGIDPDFRPGRGRKPGKGTQNDQHAAHTSHLITFPRIPHGPATGRSMAGTPLRSLC